MTTRLSAAAVGSGFGFVIAWAGLTDTTVIRRMLLLAEPDVFLLMGSAIVTAGIGLRLLRAFGLQSLVTREPIAWTTPAIEPRHIGGSALFGAGWSVACTCPGPVAAMMGQGRAIGFIVGAGLMAGIVLRGLKSRPKRSA